MHLEMQKCLRLPGDSALFLPPPVWRLAHSLVTQEPSEVPRAPLTKWNVSVQGERNTELSVTLVLAPARVSVGSRRQSTLRKHNLFT